MADKKNIIRLALTAESNGFYSASVHDHLLWDHNQHITAIATGSKCVKDAVKEPNFFEPFTTLSHLAGITESIKLETAVIVLPIRNPIVTAREAAMVDILSDGRLILGVGAGSMPSEFQKLFPNISPNHRGSITNEYLEVIEQLWTSDEPEFKGEHISIDHTFACYPHPIQKPRPKVWHGGGSVRAMKTIGESADGWITLGQKAESLEQNVSKIRRYVKENGKTMNDIEISLEIFASLKRVRESSVRVAENTLLTPDMMAKGITTNEIVASNLLGTSSDWVAQIERFAQVGATHFELRQLGDSIEELDTMLVEIARDIIPSFS